VIAETGAGQHGRGHCHRRRALRHEVLVYMARRTSAGRRDTFYRMKLLGAEVVPVESGSRTLKDALNEAMRTGSPTSRTPSTSSAPSPARTRTR